MVNVSTVNCKLFFLCYSQVETCSKHGNVLSEGYEYVKAHPGGFGYAQYNKSCYKCNTCISYIFLKTA